MFSIVFVPVIVNDFANISGTRVAERVIDAQGWDDPRCCIARRDVSRWVRTFTRVAVFIARAFLCAEIRDEKIRSSTQYLINDLFRNFFLQSVLRPEFWIPVNQEANYGSWNVGDNYEKWTNSLEFYNFISQHLVNFVHFCNFHLVPKYTID